MDLETGMGAHSVKKCCADTASACVFSASFISSIFFGVAYLLFTQGKRSFHRTG